MSIALWIVGYLVAGAVVLGVMTMILPEPEDKSDNDAKGCGVILLWPLVLGIFLGAWVGSKLKGQRSKP